MKIIAAYKSSGREEPGRLNTMIWPDSAMIRSGKPLFVRDDTTCRIIPGIAAAVKSVGKTIRPKFASRYYDEVAPICFILPLNVAREIEKESDPKACNIVADYSIICGDFIPKETLDENLELSLSSSTLSGESLINETLYFPNWEATLADAISAASRLNTLKTGDILATIAPLSIEARRDTLLRATFGDAAPLIENKIK